MTTLIYQNTVDGMKKLYNPEYMSKIREYVYSPTVSGMYIYLERTGSHAGLDQSNYDYYIRSIIKPKYKTLFLSHYCNDHYVVSSINDRIDYTTYYRFSKSPKSITYHETTYTHCVNVGRHKETITVSRYGDKYGIYAYGDTIYDDKNIILTSDFIQSDTLPYNKDTIQRVYGSPIYIQL